MSFIDLIILGVMVAFAWSGFRLGFFHMIGALVGMILGVVLASRWFEAVGHWFATTVGGSENIWRIVAFTIIYVIIARACGWLSGLLVKTFSFIPLAPTIDKIVGLGFGILEGLVLLALVAYLASKVIFGTPLATAIKNSFLGAPLAKVGAIMEPIIPEAITKLKSLF